MALQAAGYLKTFINRRLNQYALIPVFSLNGFRPRINQKLGNKDMDGLSVVSEEQTSVELFSYLMQNIYSYKL